MHGEHAIKLMVKKMTFANCNWIKTLKELWMKSKATFITLVIQWIAKNKDVFV